jgi:hypothetical protein
MSASQGQKPPRGLADASAGSIVLMGNHKTGHVTRDERADLRRRRFQTLSYVGLVVLALATAFVVALALRR